MTPLELPTGLLLDGATGTELGKHGVDLSPPLWSARAMINSHDALREVHESYLRAGAEAITTNTFRSNARAIAKAIQPLDWTSLTQTAVRIVRKARDNVNIDALILGSVAPVEDCYEPHLAPDETTAEREHALMIETLLEAGVDAILLETFGTLRETRGAVRAAKTLAPNRWMLSVLPKHGGQPGELFSGESMESLIDLCDNTLAIGVNCLPADEVVMHLEWLRARVSTRTRLLAYANTARCDAHGHWSETNATDPAVYAQHAARWLDAGATIIGSCCGTTPAHTRALRRLIDERASSARNG